MQVNLSFIQLDGDVKKCPLFSADTGESRRPELTQAVAETPVCPVGQGGCQPKVQGGVTGLA